MEIVKITNVFHDKVLLKDENDKTISSLTMTRESNCCFFKELNPLLLTPNGSVLYLSEFGTLRNYRKKGYGKELLKTVLEDYGDDIIYLGVSSTNKDFTNSDLIKFYESVGFKKIVYDLPYQFMVYDKHGKITDEDLYEKVNKITPKKHKGYKGTYHKYDLPGLDNIHLRDENEVFTGHCALLKHSRHIPYSQLFLQNRILNKEDNTYKIELHPLYDSKDREILIKCRRDNMNVYITRAYRGGQGRFVLEYDSDWGFDM